MLIAGVCTLVAATALSGIWAASGKTVTIEVDGQSREVSTLSGSVSGALASAGIAVTEHDTVAPAADAAISDGSRIAINRGRQLTVTIDGVSHVIWTTALTVDQALAQLGQGQQSLELSADRSRAIPLEGMTLTADTLHVVSLTDGTGLPTTSASSAVNVGAMLAEKQIVLGPNDTVAPAPTTPITDGLAVSITRTVITSAVADEAVAQPADVPTEDPNLARGTSTVTIAGSAGTAAVTYQITMVNGVQTDKHEVSRTVTVAPVASQISVGTKSSLTYVGNQVFFNDTEFGVNWDGLANCESTHNPRAINGNPSAGLPTYGLFQFDLPTWASVGGSGNPIDATPEEQILRAKLLFQSRGLEPWACRYAA